MSDFEALDTSADELGRTETFRSEISTVNDVNDATRKFSSILNELRQNNDSVDLQVVVAEVEDDEVDDEL